MENKIITQERDILELLKPIADTFKVAVTELWGIFINQYIVKGIAELFTGVICLTISIFLYKHLPEYYKLFGIAPFMIFMGFAYDSIQLIGNPKYWALEDIMRRLK